MFQYKGKYSVQFCAILKADIKSPDESTQLRRLIWAFTVHICIQDTCSVYVAQLLYKIKVTK